MFPFAKRWMLVAAIGQSVLFSLAFTGFVRITCWLAGITLSEHFAGNIFLASSMLTGGLAAYLYGRSVKYAHQAATGPAEVRK